MTKQFYDELNQWQASCESRRSVTIQIGDAFDHNYESAYAYDYDLKEGALVENITPLQSDPSTRG